MRFALSFCFKIYNSYRQGCLYDCDNIEYSLLYAVLGQIGKMTEMQQVLKWRSF